MKITSIEKRDGSWHVAFIEGGIVGNRIYSDPYEVFRFLIESGFHMSGISYEFPESPEGFTENVTMVGNRKEWEVPIGPIRGYRNPSPVDEFQVDIETVMGEIETLYRGRSLG